MLNLWLHINFWYDKEVQTYINWDFIYSDLKHHSSITELLHEIFLIKKKKKCTILFIIKIKFYENTQAFFMGIMFITFYQ